jgi:poly(hydroxyalkanoate) granule-associated protein
MATKSNPFNDKFKSAAQFSDTVKDSAQQIWLAGLGAFAKAQEEGGKVFDTLVKEGVSIQKKTQAAAEEKLAEASSRMSTVTADISAKASGQWDKLEGIFEERVAKALNKMGMPSAKDVQALMDRVDALSQQIQAMAPAKSAARPTTAVRSRTPVTAKKTAAKKVAAKRASPRKTTRTS